jgi:hypothetical protein
VESAASSFVRIELRVFLCPQALKSLLISLYKREKLVEEFIPPVLPFPVTPDKQEKKFGILIIRVYS